MKKRNIILFVLIVVFSDRLSGQIKYPITKKVEAEDIYWNVSVKDPYRWLENDRSEETADWVKMQRQLTNSFLGKIPFRQKIHDRLTHLWNYPSMTVPYKKHRLFFYTKIEKLQNQSVLYATDDLKNQGWMVLDPNKLSKDGTVALTETALSDDEKYLVYSIARAGSDWNEICVKDIKTGQLLPDHLYWVKYSSIAWYKNGFFYSAFDRPIQTKVLTASSEYHKVFFHKLGDRQSDDRLVVENREAPKRLFDAAISEDKRFFILSQEEAGSGNALSVKSLKNGVSIVISRDFDSQFAFIDDEGDDLYFLTNYKAPCFRLIKVNCNHPAEKDWQTIIPEQKEVLQSCQVVNHCFVCLYMKDAHSEISLYDHNGVFKSEIKLPGIGTVNAISGKKDENWVCYSYTSMNTPVKIFRYDFQTEKSTLYFQSPAAFNPDEFVVEQVFCPGKNGTKIPVFLLYKKGIKKDSNNPTLLYGYGGFDISLTPSFSVKNIVWAENGGIYAMACLRGGGEYGESWHEAGMKMHKQNVFDDCISVAEYLIKEKYTIPQKLALMGGSNGGLLVGAVVNQRPDLFRAAIPQVGVMDMLRYNKFTIGWSWAGDYGTAEESKAMFHYLYQYSPYYNIKQGIKYPAILATTADHDDRVVPAHTFKYIARMQELNTGENPTLVRIETNAGHGAGKPVSKMIDEATDVWSFLFYFLKGKI